MLNCVYHPLDDMRVVDNDEREQLLASGEWFDSPDKAKQLLKKVNSNIEKEKYQKQPKKEDKS